MSGLAWMDSALCAQTDGALWFPELGTSSRPAVRICRRCPVMAACREFGLAVPAGWPGVYGGMSAEERRSVRAARNAETEIAA